MFRVFFVVALLCVGVVYAQNKPVNTINAKVNPNLAAAQAHILQAWDFVGVAQVQNHYDMQDHAVNAKVYLDKAASEIDLAAKLADAK